MISVAMENLNNIELSCSRSKLVVDAAGSMSLILFPLKWVPYTGELAIVDMFSQE